jgi:RNA polymerase sigma-70 factor (ECF subfamily)
MGLDAIALPVSDSSAAARAVFEAEALPHREALLATARRLTGRVDQAEDLVQETLLRALRSAHRYRPGTNARAWLYRILHRVRVDTFRERGRAPATVALEGEGPLVAPRQDWMVSGGDALERALVSVPEPYRSALVLRDLKELSYHEIADVLGVPPGTVMSRIHRGRSLLRAAFGPRRDSRRDS